MIKGLYSAFSAMEAAWRYQDVISNNIANANTVGYRREVATQESFADVLLSQSTPIPAPLTARIQQVVGQMGTGTFVAEFTTDFQSGVSQPTGQELDFALNDGFFQLEGEDGTVFATRDGRFGRDANGDLVSSHGHYVLDQDGNHINLPDEPVSVAVDGTIAAGGTEIARIGIVDFTPNQLTRAGEAYFTATGPGAPTIGSPGLMQGFLEGSNSSVVEEMTSLMAVQRTYQANQAVLAKLDATLDQAAGELGRL